MFGNSAVGAAKVATAAVKPLEDLVVPIANIKSANWFYKTFKSFGITQKVGKGGMSQEDLVQRMMLFALYAAQQVGAVFTHQHVWETFGRNLGVWSIQSMGTLYAKSPEGPLVRLLNNFMQPKKVLSEGASVFERAINHLRPSVDFRQVLEEAGLKPQSSINFWSKLDQNENMALNNLYREKKEIAKAALPKAALDEYNATPKQHHPGKLIELLNKHAPDALTAKDKRILKEVPQFLVNRRGTFATVQALAQMAAYIFLGGQAAMWVVYKTIARLDPDFEVESKTPKATAKPLQSIKSANNAVAGAGQRSVGAPFSLPTPLPALNALPQALQMPLIQNTLQSAQNTISGAYPAPAVGQPLMPFMSSISSAANLPSYPAQSYPAQMVLQQPYN
ncbi:MAG: hypothetical protein VKJ06_08495 [Vampirovibrionales bacterium]|nr:hypothetical protein [Vampirovibrionales bacterium]